MDDSDDLTHHLRPVDYKRLDAMQERFETPLTGSDIWYIHTVLAQCFLPYKDPKTDRWQRTNGKYSILLVSGDLKDPHNPTAFKNAGLPYGPKPRLFQSYVCTQVIKQRSPVVHVERSMTAMMKELGLRPSGGKDGNISVFKNQISRFAACHFTVVGPGPRGGDTYIKAPPIKKFDVWFPPDSRQGTLWPSEIVLTDEYYYSLKDHAVPYDFRALGPIQQKPRAMDIFLWMTQRLCRIPANKPLFLRWKDLYEMFGGQSSFKEFKRNFPQDLLSVRPSYPGLRVDELQEGYRFHHASPPIPKTQLFIK